jgi:hypothetical protein
MSTLNNQLIDPICDTLSNDVSAQIEQKCGSHVHQPTTLLGKRRAASQLEVKFDESELKKSYSQEEGSSNLNEDESEKRQRRLL